MTADEKRLKQWNDIIYIIIQDEYHQNFKLYETSKGFHNAWSMD